MVRSFAAGRGLRGRQRLDGVESGTRPDWVVVELDRPMDHRPLFGGRVALAGDDRCVVGGIARERLQHPQVVLHPVHLRAHQVVIDLLRHRPARLIDRLQAPLQLANLRQPAGDGGGRVVGNTVTRAWRLLEGSPLAEQVQQLRIGSGRDLRGERTARQDHDGGEQRAADSVKDASHPRIIRHDRNHARGATWEKQ